MESLVLRGHRVTDAGVNCSQFHSYRTHGKLPTSAALENAVVKVGVSHVCRCFSSLLARKRFRNCNCWVDPALKWLAYRRPLEASWPLLGIDSVLPC